MERSPDAETDFENKTQGEECKTTAPAEIQHTNNKNETFMKHMREDHNMETHVTQEYTSKSTEKNSIEMAFQRQLRSNKTG